MTTSNKVESREASAAGESMNWVAREGKVGPCLTELEKLARQSKYLSSTIHAEFKGTEVHFELSLAGNWPSFFGRQLGPQSVTLDRARVAQSFVECMKRFVGANFDFTTMTVASKDGPVSGKELTPLFLGAWCEAAGIDVPTADDLKIYKAVKKKRLEANRSFAIEQIRKDVSWWNKMTAEQRFVYNDMRKADFSGANLSGLHLSIQERDLRPVIELRNSNFSDANMTAVKFHLCDLRESCFDKAVLKSANLKACASAKCSFVGADLTGANFHCAAPGADFTGAALQGANLASSNFCGANFTGANLDGASFGDSTYDEVTKFPDGFVPPLSMTWAGKDGNPWHAKQAEVVTEELDFASFLERIKLETDPVRVKNALSMLKSAKFQLFADGQDEQLVGVVKSQSDPDLVYSCYLNLSGKYGCCTQNLNVCGGLRGALCKHLLVLILGLTNGGDFSATTACNWMLASKLSKPVLDKELLTATLLRYKGAEAGEIDWRPSETIPEDFYAY